MKLVFTDQYANILFLVNGLAILFYLSAKKKKKQRAMKFGNYETLQKVAGKNFLKSSNILLVTRILALTALVVGISSPVLVEEVPSTNTDYIIAIDSSASMLASDFEPTRFEASKRISSDFISQLEKPRAGVLSFSGDVNQESEVVSDREQIQTAIRGIETGTTAGTAIGDAIYTSTSMLLGANRSKTVILVTDGRNNVGSSINESVEYAKSHNTTINAIGIGESDQSNSNFGTVEGVNASRADYPNLDTRQLFYATNQTGGELVTVTNSSGLENAFMDLQTSKERTDISKYFIFLALFLMLSEWILGSTRYSILP